MNNGEIICPHCKNKNVVKRGYFQTRTHGKQQRYYCKSCNRKFVLRTPFYRMRNSPHKITLCLDLFFRGISTRKVQEHLQAFYPHNSSWVSIYNWVIKYSNFISGFTDTLKPILGSEVQVDEVEFHRRKSHKLRAGVAKNWFIDSIDPKTRFAVAADFVEERSTENIKSVMQNIKRKTENIKMITTDGLTAYTNVVKKTFGYSNKLGRYTVFHNVVCASQGDGFNYPIERLHNNLRARTKVMRWFHGSVESARAIMNGMIIYYNFITRHQGINKTPAEEAGIKLDLYYNKWLSLINLASDKSLCLD